MNRAASKLANKIRPKSAPTSWTVLVWVSLFATVGIATLLLTRAASPFASLEPETSASLSSGASVLNDASASGGKYVSFQTPTSVGRFNTLPVGAVLPNDAACSSQVRTAAEKRFDNAVANQTKGTSPNGRYPRVTGNYTGTTDEIIQWAACKWGVDEDMARAQTAIESYWHQNAAGDFTTDAAACAPGHPIGADGRPGQCAESIGLLQVRFLYHSEAFKDNNAGLSSAYNIDYNYAVWRDCFEGTMTWLNTVERGATYVGGDAWGCMGVWFSGRWMTQPAIDYINAVKGYYNQKIWTGSGF